MFQADVQTLSKNHLRKRLTPTDSNHQTATGGMACVSDSGPVAIRYPKAREEWAGPDRA